MADDDLPGKVRQFLSHFRSLATSPDSLILVNRKDGKNQITLEELEFTKSDVLAELLRLEPENYCSHGPDRDKPESSPVWVFGKRIKGKEIYIKIKVSSASKTGKSKPKYPQIPVCISFHKAEHALEYGLK